MHQEVIERHRDDNKPISRAYKIEKKLFFLKKNILDRVPPM